MTYPCGVPLHGSGKIMVRHYSTLSCTNWRPRSGDIGPISYAASPLRDKIRYFCRTWFGTCRTAQYGLLTRQSRRVFANNHVGRLNGDGAARHGAGRDFGIRPTNSQENPKSQSAWRASLPIARINQSHQSRAGQPFCPSSPLFGHPLGMVANFGSMKRPQSPGPVQLRPQSPYFLQKH